MITPTPERASEAGQIVSLQAIVTRVQAEFTGSLVAVELRVKGRDAEPARRQQHD